MAMVNAKYQFLWGSCGFPGNSHDSVILQSASVWSKVWNGSLTGWRNVQTKWQAVAGQAPYSCGK